MEKIQESTQEQDGYFKSLYEMLKNYNDMDYEKQAITEAFLCAKFDFRTFMDVQMASGENTGNINISMTLNEMRMMLYVETARVRAMRLMNPKTEKILNSVGISVRNENGYRAFHEVLHDAVVKYADLGQEEGNKVLYTLLCEPKYDEEQEHECE